jgi:hypothetical protein
LIMRAQETEIPWRELQQLLLELERACEQFDYERIRILLLKVVAEYAPQCGIEDFLWQENGRLFDGIPASDIGMQGRPSKPDLKQVIK